MIGRTIGRYRIDAELGRGGMGVVYRATQTNLGRTVAIKMLSPQLAGSREHLGRFRREAEVLARLQHENIVHIYDVEEVEGAFCIIMEYVAGPSLGAVLARERVLPPAAVKEIAIQITAGLAVAHRKGIVHRDLKPDNILFTPEGRPRITDFGIARIAGGDAAARTRTGILMGTPYYMSPEQAAGGEVTGASDVYSLGVLLYQMLSGRVPFDGTDPISLAIKHMQSPVPPLEETMPGLPRPMVAMVDRALEKEPHRRFPSAAAMGSSLRTLDLGPSPLPSLVAHDGAETDGADECPECGCVLHAAFVTCPRCALPLRETGSDDASPPVLSLTGQATAEPPPSRPENGPRRRRGTGGPGQGLAPPVPTAARGVGAGAVAGAVAEQVLAWPAELLRRLGRPDGLDWWPRGPAAWLSPRGRWGMPPILWAGLGIVAVGVMLGLLGGPLGASGGSGQGSPWVSGGSAANAGAAFGAGNGAGSGGSAAGSAGGSGMPSGGIFPPVAAPTDDAEVSPDDDDAGVAEGGAGEADHAPEDGPGPGEADDGGVGTSEREETADDGTVRVSETGGRDNLPPGFDIEKARRDLVGVVERQRQATERGDAELFVRDLTPELARGAADDLAGLHRQWSDLQSQVWNLTIYFEDATRARVDFHTRISGVASGRSGRRVVQDTHVYWALAHRDDRWVIIDASSGSHDGGRP